MHGAACGAQVVAGWCKGGWGLGGGGGNSWLRGPWTAQKPSIHLPPGAALQDDAMDAILYVRLLVAMLTGITCGVLGSQGLYVFLGCDEGGWAWKRGACVPR